MPHSPTPDASSPGTADPWILVVDDEPSIRRLMEFLLKSQGWNVQAADGAAQAMELIDLSPLPPTLVICDVLMPRVDGLELVRRMCARLKGLNVIFVSGHLTDVSWWPEDLKDHRSSRRSRTP
jgi:two-component system, cell cycle sensor histidine kinase and response regulator CckA